MLPHATAFRHFTRDDSVEVATTDIKHPLKINHK